MSGEMDEDEVTTVPATVSETVQIKDEPDSMNSEKKVGEVMSVTVPTAETTEIRDEPIKMDSEKKIDEELTISAPAAVETALEDVPITIESEKKEDEEVAIPTVATVETTPKEETITMDSENKEDGEGKVSASAIEEIIQIKDEPNKIDSEKKDDEDGTVPSSETAETVEMNDEARTSAELPVTKDLALLVKNISDNSPYRGCILQSESGEDDGNASEGETDGCGGLSAVFQLRDDEDIKTVSPETLYNLAMAIKHNTEEKDSNKMIEYLKEAASRKPFLTNGKPNRGVVKAQNTLGLLYSQGIDVISDTQQGFMWFNRCAGNGSRTAANNLAYCYLNGIGTRKCFTRAEQYFRFAGDRGLVTAMNSLAHFYLVRSDPHQAKMWFDRAVETGETVDFEEFERFDRALEKMKYNIDTSEVAAWESHHNMPYKFLSFDERRARMEKYVYPDGRSKHSNQNSLDSKPNGHSRDNHHKCLEHLPHLLERAQQGSKYAGRVIDAVNHFENAMKLLLQVAFIGTNCKDVDEEIIHELAECFRLENAVAYWSDQVKLAARTVIDRVIASLPKNTSSTFDKEARICFANLNWEDLGSNLKFLEDCIRRYPNELFFHTSRSCGLQAKDDAAETGLREVSRALEIFPNAPQLLFLKACFIKNLRNFWPLEKIAAFQEYLKVADSDLRSVPLTHYYIAHQYYLMAESPKTKLSKAHRNMTREQKKEYLDLACEFVSRGYATETCQLPCFLPYYSGDKDSIEKLLGMTNPNPCSDRDEVIIDPHILHLLDPSREEIIKNHRKYAFELRENKSTKIVLEQSGFSEEPRTALELLTMKPIYIRELHPCKEMEYNGFALNVTVIEDPIFTENTIYSVVQDDFGDVRRAMFKNITEEDFQGSLVFGGKFTILCPSTKKILETKFAVTAVYIEDPRSLLLQGKKLRWSNPCRYCGNENAIHSCARCKETKYCSKECQREDWKRMKHKLICINRDSTTA